MVRVAVLGATGYAARELLLLLLRHPQAEITALTTRQDDRPTATQTHPVLQGRLDALLENLTAAEVAERAECVFSCLPHAASAATVRELLRAGCRVIDFSADYRLRDPEVYRQWYDVEHPDREHLREAVYGLPELYREAIRGTRLVANPGCYPTSAILALAPLLKAGAISSEGIVVDSKSGVSGAGRNTKPHLHFPECNESVAAYGVGNHRHTPEIDQILSDAEGRAVEVVFTPHLMPMDRGILTTAYATARPGATTERLAATLREFYAGEQFVRVSEDLPRTRDVAGTNYCNLTVRCVRGKAVVVSVIDNLVKGAAGAAVQNFNLLYGFEERTALL
jgi:N-acetyl-gamma-glutamyl-phosphate reductase